MVYHATPRCANVGRRGLNARERVGRSADGKRGSTEAVVGGEGICDENERELSREKARRKKRGGERVGK